MKVTLTFDLLFRFVESADRKNQSLDTRLSLFLNRHSFLSKPLLFFVVVKDGRHVLATSADSWVVVGPKHLQQSTVVGFGGVVRYLDRFSMVSTRKMEKNSDEFKNLRNKQLQPIFPTDVFA